MRFPLSMFLFAMVLVPACADDDFEKNVRPLLVKHCSECHGPKKQSGGLRLDSRAAIFKGGENGPAAVTGKPDDSLLVKALGHKDEPRMPPDGKLADKDIATLKEWIRRGLPGLEEKPPVAGPAVNSAITAEQRKWWSFQPIRPTAPPMIADDTWSKTEIDRFVLAKLKAKGLTPAAPADKRTLLRRATYDLTGLPPTSAEVDAFLKDDKPDAFAKVIERLLASPAYGERWGRHWLDVVRYADTAGENSDHPVPDAWRYRNWVIDAFNADKPYDEFVREQIAGDILAAKGPEEKYAARVIATGFLAIARRFDNDPDTVMHLTFEDTIDTLGKAFLGLSISCARCHDHKYDPITAKDYYGLYGILQSSKFTYTGCEPKQQPRDRVPLLSPTAMARRTAEQAKEVAALDGESKAIAEARKGERSRPKQTLLAKGEILDGGSQAVALPKNETVDVKVGETLVLSVSPLGNHGADSTLVQWEIADADGKRTWDLTDGALADFPTGNPKPDRHGHKDVWAFIDGRAGRRIFTQQSRDIQGKPGLHSWGSPDTPSVFANTTDKPIEAWAKLPARSVFLHPAPDGNVAVAWVSPIAGKVRITGRIADAHAGGPDGVGWFLERFPYNLVADLQSAGALAPREAELAKRRAELSRMETAYAVVEGKVGHTKLHLRGDPEKPGAEVPRRWLELFGAPTVPADAGSGRLQLAGWLTDPANPLTARVMANRVWQYHFGKGLVKTPNDFGTRGLTPTHPELLDWLADSFANNKWSVKALHRRIMLSAVYQQAVVVRPGAEKVDPANDLYWRFDRRPLSAEELRDSLLMASGQLDRTPGGAHPFPPESSWNFTQHVPFSTVYETDKRSVYLTTLRNRRNPFFALFDGADPNSTTPQRQVTTVPTQALFFMNDPFFHAQAEKIAAAVLVKPDDGARLDELYRLAFQRPPTANVRETAITFLAKYTASLTDVPAAARPKVALSALVRILLASNDYLYVE